MPADPPTWFQTPDLMQLVIILLFTAFIWFAIRTLRLIDQNQQVLFDRMTILERDFYILRGEHNAHHRREGER